MTATTEISKEQSTTSSASKTITLRIARYNPSHDSATKYMEFNIPYGKWTTVLDAILDVKKIMIILLVLDIHVDKLHVVLVE